MKLSASEWLLHSVQLTTIAKKSIKNEAHVIICGAGVMGVRRVKRPPAAVTPPVAPVTVTSPPRLGRRPPREPRPDATARPRDRSTPP